MQNLASPHFLDRLAQRAISFQEVQACVDGGVKRKQHSDRTLHTLGDTRVITGPGGVLITSWTEVPRTARAIADHPVWSQAFGNLFRPRGRSLIAFDVDAFSTVQVVQALVEFPFSLLAIWRKGRGFHWSPEQKTVVRHWGGDFLPPELKQLVASRRFLRLSDSDFYTLTFDFGYIGVRATPDGLLVYTGGLCTSYGVSWAGLTRDEIYEDCLRELWGRYAELSAVEEFRPSLEGHHLTSK